MGTRLLQRIVLPAYINSTRQAVPNLVRCEPTLLRTINFTDFTAFRSYAKSKDKGKERKGKGMKVSINPLEIEELVPLHKLKDRCNHAIEQLKEDFSKNLSLRSTTGSIESLPVRFEGKNYELQELAQIIRKNPKTMVINFSSFPQAIPDALKAISASGLNLNPQQDGTTLFVPVPKVTKEHRQTLAKNAKALYIECRDKLKDIQNEYVIKAKKQTGVSEDLIYSVIKQLNAICEEYLMDARRLYDVKYNELIGGK